MLLKCGMLHGSVLELVHWTSSSVAWRTNTVYSARVFKIMPTRVDRSSQHSQGQGCRSEGPRQARGTDLEELWIQKGQLQSPTPEGPCQWHRLRNDWLGSSSVEKALADGNWIMSQQHALTGEANSTPGFIGKSLASRWRNWLFPLLSAQ